MLRRPTIIIIYASVGPAHGCTVVKSVYTIWLNDVHEKRLSQWLFSLSLLLLLFSFFCLFNDGVRRTKSVRESVRGTSARKTTLYGPPEPFHLYPRCCVIIIIIVIVVIATVIAPGAFRRIRRRTKASLGVIGAICIRSAKIIFFYVLISL